MSRKQKPAKRSVRPHRTDRTSKATHHGATALADLLDILAREPGDELGVLPENNVTKGLHQKWITKQGHDKKNQSQATRKN